MKDVYEYIDKHQDQYIEWLQELCRIPSVAAQNRGMQEAADKVAEYLKEKVNGKAELVSTAGFPVVYGKLAGKKEKTLSFYNHYDVQPEDPLELWNYPPFEADIENGKMYARGVADNKGNLVARIAAVHAYQQVRGELPLNIKFIVEGEEEIGSVNLEGFGEENEDLIKADGCIWEFGYRNADGRQQVSLGVKGMAYVELVCRGANTDMHSANAAVIENPAWRLIWALSTLKDKNEHVQIEGFYDKVLSLTKEEEEAINQLIYSEEEMLEQLELQSFLLNLNGDELKEKLIFQPTCNICGIESGYTGEGSKTVLPSEARAKLDFRLVPDQDPHEIVSLLRNHLDKHGFEDIEIIKMGMEKPAKTPFDDPLAESVISSTKQVSNLEPTVMPMSPGTGPMYELCQKFGIPSVSVGVGNFESNNHAPNENINIEDYVDGIKLIATVLEDYAKR
ncbi:M20/M25/M40 family metallo-hydrolase [Pseudalkalibacillus caeni]|uniref:M20/M25/M40 family metallo-hydrolase n=1 Tax=Exobacillus caeni TaxID=2574798 RepID=A0A5R9F6P5_9BACL|nr:M20/M25/M40 family metallo-hydrolase [Pseudalkalibacillus caeni]TLS38701.1 M20/M25/M40 family metallo-hydrolase [Pseudalkalibacillus caeni]